MSPIINKGEPEAWELVTLTLAVHHATERAVLVSIEGERSSAVWVPKRPLHDLPDDVSAGDTITVRMTQRLAESKGLV
ncbi:MAG: hypothetical protein DI629_03585 [Mesorhizobium amorphae]|nr:MAG: hypothetical protein DI629_03585 [Mesorhizobium amorphae]